MPIKNIEKYRNKIYFLIFVDVNIIIDNDMIQFLNHWIDNKSSLNLHKKFANKKYRNKICFLTFVDVNIIIDNDMIQFLNHRIDITCPLRIRKNLI